VRAEQTVMLAVDAVQRHSVSVITTILPTATAANTAMLFAHDRMRKQHWPGSGSPSYDALSLESHTGDLP
jgi:hypothetical protein